MARTIESPVTKTDGDSTRTTHPAFGQMRVSRVQGNIDLYGSDFTHHSFVHVEIHRSELHRNLSHDWHFSRETVLQLAMSEAQWATFVSSFNMGSGVPVTVEFADGDFKPGLPTRKSFSLYKGEATESFNAALAQLQALHSQVSEATSKLSKKAQGEILGPIWSAIATLTSTLPFIQKSFDEHMETSVEKAKVEVNAYATNIMMQAGISALQGGAPLLIETDKTEVVAKGD